MSHLRLPPFLFCVLFIALGIAGVAAADDADRSKPNWRWNDHPFVFVLVTDDGTKCNLGWADIAREMDFRFTIAVNPSVRDHPKKLTPAEMHDLYEDGFEIANHTYSHGHAGVPLDCPIPPRGSLLAYYLCDGFAPGEAMTYFQAEIERDSVAAVVGLPVCDVRALAYPNHRHSIAVIDSLEAEGYLGARYGENSSYEGYSNGDFTVPARNSWDGGISLYRVPVAHYTTAFFGNHSADPPVHFTHEAFVAATQPYVDQAVADGGMFVIYSHHYGDDDDAYGDINYHSGGMTCEDLAWIVDLVRNNGGVVMTFGEALAFYRSRTQRVEMDGDLVWMPLPTAVSSGPTGAIDVTAGPNPCNARTRFTVRIQRNGVIDLELYDLAGRRVRRLVHGFRTCGEHCFDWNGRDDHGCAVGSGVYFVRLCSGGTETSTRITLLK